MIGLPLRNQQEFTGLLQQIYDPASTHFHHYLTPGQIAELFGPTPEDYQAVVAFAQANGLLVLRTHSDRTLLDVSGSVTDIEKALHVTMRVYQHPTEHRTFFAPDVDPSLDLSTRLLAISGLNNCALPRPGGSQGTPASKAANALVGGGSGPGGAYWGTNFRSAYVPGVSLTGTGQVVGLLELDGYYTNDIASYQRQAGVPSVPVTNVLVDGFSGSPDGNSSWVGEVSLDIEMTISMAPGLSAVMVYESANCCYYWVDILKRMQEDNVAKQLSCSWLFDYDDPLADPIYQEMAAQGQSFFQCSGDYLAFYNGVEQWTDDANVTLVGGTSLTMSGSGGAWASETAWNNGDGINGSGGGISASYLGNVPIPTWQQGVSMTANHGSTTKRNVPDVAMVAYDAWVIWDNGSGGWWWGTSIAAPLWAGFTALLNQQAALNGQPSVGFLNPAIYAIGGGPTYSNCFHDITTGNNTNSNSSGQFFAVSGYDLCTGWGSPNGTNLINVLASCNEVITTFGSPAGAGTISGGGLVACGSNVSVCASPTSCYAFENWTDQNSNVVSTSACYTFEATTNRILAANFSQIAYTVATSSSPSADGSTSGGGLVACGSNVTVCASPAACYAFENWTDQNSNVVSTSTCYTFEVTTNRTLVANFGPTPSYTVDTVSSPTAGGSTSGGGTEPCGSNVTVCATANPCYSFVNWTVNGNVLSSLACYSFTPTNNTTLAANFSALGSYTITTSNSPSGDGSTTGSGSYNCGSNVTVCATANSCYSFVNWTENGSPVSALPCFSFTATSNETLVANFAANSLPTGSLTNLWSFTNGPDGANPQAGLIQGSDSNFYGTTYGTGSGPSANGTVFRISPSGSLTNLWEFTGGNDGANPSSGLVQGSDSKFYGTTAWGGANGLGTVFRISPSGSLTNLWEFTGGNDGASPQSGLVQGSDSNFYGTASYGGASGNGTVFRINPGGSLSNLWSFTGGNDGANPMAGLLQGGDGNFYGTTYGSGSGPSPNGTVFRISPSGSLTNLWSFTGGNDGSYPWAALVQGSDSNFYGTASYGGAYGAGIVFRISAGGSLTNLWSFTGGTDGATPQAGLVLGSDSNFYGTTSSGGASGSGTIFRISPSGNLTNLWSFTDCADGANPMAGLVQGSDSNLYGTTYGSGNGPSSYGTVFKLSVSSALPPVAMFTANPTNGMAPLAVIFTDASSNSPTSWTWTDTYGDMSTNENPAFTYANPGAYAVQLIACNAGGCGTNSAVINVYSPFAWWQLNYFGSTNDSFNTSPQGDYTGTGMSNSNRFMAGFNPLNPAAYLHIISVAASNTNVMVTYLGASGDTNYEPGVQSRTNVLEFTAGIATGDYTNGSWTQVPGQTNILGVGLGVNGGTGLGTVTNMTDSDGATNSPSRYYRVRVLLP